MQLAKLVKETDREYQRITDVEKISYILNEYMGQRPVFLKHTTPRVQVNITEREGNLLKLTFPVDFDVPKTTFTLYVNFNKQLEFDALVDDFVQDHVVKVTISEVRIATGARTERRFRTPEDVVVTDHFLISKNRIDLNPFSYAVSNRVIFHEYERQLAVKFGDIKIKDLDPTDRSLETLLIKKHKQGAIISDTNVLEEYANTHGELNLANLQQIWKEEVQKQMKLYKEKGIKSVLLRPINYTNLKGEKFPIGYFFYKSTEKNFTAEDYHALDETADEIIERIKDANTVQVNIRQKALNVSTGGICILVDDPEFQKYVLNRDDMTFNVVFKMQSPIRLYAQVRHIYQLGKTLYVGLAFEGTVHSESGVGSKKRLQENINYLLKQGSVFEMT